MAAYGASNTVINQGTINLEKNGNYDDSLAANTLVGMAVYEHGTAINDQTGVININVGTGQAFYNDGTGTIVNYGTICTFGVCQSGNEYNNTDDFTSLIYTGGDTITRSGETVTLNKSAAVTDKLAGNVVNSGTLSGDQITVSSGLLENTSGGIINNLVKLDKGAVIKNAGVMTNNVDVSGGILNNAGEMTAQITMNAGADSSLVNNTGTINKIVQNAGVFNNSGSVTGRMMSAGGVFNNQTDGAIMRGAALTGTAVANNEGTWNLGSSSEGNNTGMLEVNNNSAFNNRGEFILDNDKNAVHINQSGTLYNTGHMNISNSSHNGAVNMWGGNGRFINDGTIDVSAKSLVVSANNAGDQNAFFWNQDNGVINFDHDSASAVKVTHSNFIAQNDGIMNISGTGAVAMEGDKNAQLVNNGTINLGTAGTTDTGMIGMQLDANATADAVIENNGTINIFANDSFAFSVLGTVGHVVNNGTVVIADGVTGSGLIKQGDSINVEGMNGNNGNSSEVHYGDYTLPDVPKPNTVSVTSGSDEAGGSMNNLNGYVVGTNVNGSAGKLKVNNASMNGVEINTGFTAGTADTTVSFDNVVEGSNLTDADAITSTSVVWTAKGSTDASGNVDVTMSKNAYTDVVEQAINSSVNLVPFGLSASTWKVHRGDLVVEGNIESNQKLIVLGNLTVKGNISTFSLSNPWVILGNVTATNIVADSPLLITGSINASGLVFIDSYYDNPSTIKGSINARGIFINDIIAPVVASSTNSEFMVRASDKHDTENVKKALMIINPDAYYWGLINDEDALKEIFKRSNIRMAGNVCNQMKKEALFRPKPSPELVQELQMLDEGKVAAFEGRDIATFDLAVMRTLPRLKGISANLRKQLINSNDEQTIESMARYMPDNEILELTDQQLGYQPVVLGLLDREPLSVEIMTRMSRLPDGVGPLNLALRENLPLDIVMTLAKRDWDMIIQELYKDAWLLPESIIDGYIRSDDSSIRQVGAGGQLTYNQAMQLANDSSNNVVTSLAFKLAEMKHHGQLLRMTPQESDKVAGYLYQKFENDDDLIRVLFLALPDNLQFNFVKRMEKKSPAYFCCRDMQVIHSDAALQRLLTRFNDPEGWSNLAKNQYLSTSMKQKIWQRALSHRKNNPKADSDAYETSADMILSELISHGEVDDQMLLNATALIRSDDWDFLESALISWDNLPAVVLKELQQNTPRNDIWAKFFLRQENSSRAQVDEALRVYYALDPDALAQLDVLAKQPDRIWWSTLAKSNLTFFKFGALNNRHTPPAVLAAEIDPEWWIVAMNNPRFPVDVLKARLKRDPLLALELVNPELDLVRQLALNGKTRAIREQAMRKLDELY
ncbi:DUF2773 domain-containing protein [Escherichia coli]